MGEIWVLDRTESLDLRDYSCAGLGSGAIDHLGASTLDPHKFAEAYILLVLTSAGDDCREVAVDGLLSITSVHQRDALVEVDGSAVTLVLAINSMM